MIFFLLGILILFLPANAATSYIFIFLSCSFVINKKLSKGIKIISLIFIIFGLAIPVFIDYFYQINWYSGYNKYMACNLYLFSYLFALSGYKLSPFSKKSLALIKKYNLESRPRISNPEKIFNINKFHIILVGFIVSSILLYYYRGSQNLFTYAEDASNLINESNLLTSLIWYFSTDTLIGMGAYSYYFLSKKTSYILWSIWFILFTLANALIGWKNEILRAIFIPLYWSYSPKSINKIKFKDLIIYLTIITIILLMLTLFASNNLEGDINPLNLFINRFSSIFRAGQLINYYEIDNFLEIFKIPAYREGTNLMTPDAHVTMINNFATTEFYGVRIEQAHRVGIGYLLGTLLSFGGSYWIPSLLLMGFIVSFIELYFLKILDLRVALPIIYHVIFISISDSYSIKWYRLFIFLGIGILIYKIFLRFKVYKKN